MDTASVALQTAAEPRNRALDGFRGLMTLFVLVSHSFAEVGHGINALMLGWIAVVAFFTLSGFLVGRLILERKDCANFFFVFYMRRMCRTIPVYLFCVGLVFLTIVAFKGAPWLNVQGNVPLWSYLTFTQGFFFVAQNSMGPHWLAPTWTLAVEEQFYLIIPAIFFFTPRKALLPLLGAGFAASIGLRAAIVCGGLFPPLTGSVMLPSVADALICGLIAAVLIKETRIDWSRFDLTLRVVPILALVCVMALMALPGGFHHPLAQVFARSFVAVGVASFLLSLVRGAPEAKRLSSPMLCFFGNTSYTVYMTHVAVLGLMHGLILGTPQNLATPAQWAVTVAALPVVVLVGWAGTKLVEEPITALGRSLRWSKRKRTVATAPAPAFAAA